MLDMFWQYNGDSLYLAAFFVCLVLLVLADRKNGGTVGKKAAAALGLSILFVFNQVVYLVMDKITDAKTYYRFFWMLPVLFLIALHLTRAFFSGQKKQAVAAALAFALCIAVGGNLFISRKNLSRPQNVYALAPDTIAVAQEIMKDWGESRKKQPVAAFDMYLQYQVRTYEPRICWGISRKAYLYQAEHGYDKKQYARQQQIIAVVNEGIRTDQKQLARSMKKLGVNYLVIRTAFAMDGYLSEIGAYPVAQCENYTVYRVRKVGKTTRYYVNNSLRRQDIT